METSVKKLIKWQWNMQMRFSGRTCVTVQTAPIHSTELWEMQQKEAATEITERLDVVIRRLLYYRRLRRRVGSVERRIRNAEVVHLSALG